MMVSDYFLFILFLEDEATPDLLKKAKEYSVKFVFPPTTILQPPVLGLYGK